MEVEVVEVRLTERERYIEWSRERVYRLIRERVSERLRQRLEVIGLEIPLPEEIREIEKSAGWEVGEEKEVKAYREPAKRFLIRRPW